MPHVWGCPQRPEEGINPLELELPTALSLLGGPRKQAQILWQSGKLLTAELFPKSRNFRF